MAVNGRQNSIMNYHSLLNQTQSIYSRLVPKQHQCLQPREAGNSLQKQLGPGHTKFFVFSFSSGKRLFFFCHEKGIENGRRLCVEGLLFIGDPTLP